MAMNFRRRRPPEDPEINLIPFIDVVLDIPTYLRFTTTHAKVREPKINMPTANAQASKSRPAEVVVLVAADGRYMVNQRMLAGRGIETLAASLAQVAGNAKDTVVIINADAQASHQSVINVMDAARRVGLTQLTFATQGQHDGAASSGP